MKKDKTIGKRKFIHASKRSRLRKKVKTKSFKDLRGKLDIKIYGDINESVLLK